MAKKVKIDSLRLEPAKNGNILRYSKTTKNDSKRAQVYPSSNYEDVSEVFNGKDAHAQAAKRIQQLAEQHFGNMTDEPETTDNTQEEAQE